ncbi:type II toxin-antitoxin system RelE/ParE family toxin [Shinella sp. CPCC 100929]|uniref:Toxin n=1 Tax=Shinella lacus TaxID=2654216 RepID=A0ABT1RA20_9HYPH|nr:type II toxin-antitoxin system RelE/ParE family toxin [Shinella lacus]
MQAIRFTESAEKDIDAILSYTMSAWGDAQTEAYIDGLYRILEMISANPAAGRLRPELAPDLRSFPHREHLIFYVLIDAEVLVIRVLAARQNVKPDAFRP